MLNPNIAKKLMSEVPEMKEFVAFLSSQAILLNQLSDIELDDPIELAVEVKSRQRAYETIIRILEPLVNVQDEITTGIKNEYVV